MAQRPLRVADAGDGHSVHAARRVRLSLPHPRARGRRHDGEDSSGAVAVLTFARTGQALARRRASSPRQCLYSTACGAGSGGVGVVGAAGIVVELGVVVVAIVLGVEQAGMAFVVLIAL